MYRKNTAGQFVTFCMISSTDGSPVTGITPTVRRCIDGTFAAGGGTVTEDTGLGFYKYAMAQADTNGNNIGLRFTGTGAIDTVVNFVTTAADPTDGVRFGLTALPNAAADAAGGLPVSDAGGLDLDAKLAATNEVTAARMGALTDWIDGGRLDLLLDAILADTGTDGVVVAAASKTGYVLSAAGVDAILDEAITEPAGVFTWAGATLRNIVGWMGALSRNKLTQTATTQTLRNDADGANLATSTHSDDGTTHTRGEWS